MKLSRVLCLILAMLMLVSCFTACKSGTGTSSDSSGESNSSQELHVSSDPNASSEGTEDFDADKDNSTTGSIPSSPTNTTDDNTDNTNGGNYGDNDGDSKNNKKETSLFDDMSTFTGSGTFKYQTSTYIYGITKTGVERLAFVNDDGSYTDVLAGGGNFNLNSEVGIVARANGVKGFERTLINNRMAVIVTYNVSGMEAGSTQLKTTYVFYEEHVEVRANVRFNSDKTAITGGSLQRVFISGVDISNVEKDIDFDWIYPDSLDYPYRYTAAYVTKHLTNNGKHAIYTFNTGNIPERYWDFQVRYPATAVPVTFGDTAQNSIDYTATYSMVFAEEEEDDSKAKYRARFMAKGSDFAAGIAPTEVNSDSSTLFRRDSVTLNMNVTNLTSDDLTFSARYEVYDYYGNLVKSGIHINSTVFGGLEANRDITISAAETGYGMYFLNYLVITDKYSYREYYPFMLLDDYEYKYYKNNIFGIQQTGVEPTKNSRSNVYSMFNKIGVATTRGGFSMDGYIDEELVILEDMKQKGFKYIEHGGLNKKKNDTFGAYFTDVISGNEKNMALNSMNSPTAADVERVWNEYYIETYVPHKSICSTYGKTLVHAGISAASTNWLNAIYSHGLWGKDDDKLSIHVYSMNYHAPDNKAANNAMWSVEGGLKRTVKAIENYGDVKWQIHEMGYSTVPDGTYVDIRTQADYNIRCFILAAAYGAETAATYCFFDYSNTGVGTSFNDMEYHFGSFYFPDYYGRTLPKPPAMAFATMTRQLESLKSCKESTKYSNMWDQQGGTLRVFTFDTELYGEVLVAWSNNYQLPNDLGQERITLMPWEKDKLWGDHTEDLVVDAIGDSVTVVDVNGGTTTVAAVGGKATIKVTGSPVFIKGAK